MLLTQVSFSTQQGPEWAEYFEKDRGVLKVCTPTEARGMDFRLLDCLSIVGINLMCQDLLSQYG